MSLSSFFSSIFPTAYAEAPEAEPEKQEETASKQEEATEEEEDTADAAIAEEAEEEEEDPEDIAPAIREECQQTGKAAAAAKHFAHCEEKVNAGKGYQGEDCVEELCTCVFSVLTWGPLTDRCYVSVYSDFTDHLIHLVDECSAGKVFSKLR